MALNVDKIKIRPASGIIDYFWLRQLRNESSHFLTGNSSNISAFKQFLFFLNTPSFIKIYIVNVNNIRAGYLLIRKDGDVCFITEVLKANFRGFGLGTSMIDFAKTLTSHLIAEILITNLASIRLHEKNGFNLISSKDNIVKYQYSHSIIIK
jgi:RimJ/RimL family protein N-acetyltransferase